MEVNIGSLFRLRDRKQIRVTMVYHPLVYYGSRKVQRLVCQGSTELDEVDGQFITMRP